MAGFRAITAVSDAIVHLLESQYSPADFDDASLQFKVYLARDFTNTPMDAGVSVFLYRIYPNGTYRTPPGRLGPDGRRQRPMLPIDMHLLLTAWAKDASLQHAIAGWMMRTLEDTPSLPPGLLNHRYPGTFQPDETVELCLTELTTEELFRIWEVIVSNAYQISVPYVARNVRIESIQRLYQGEPVQERVMDYQKLIKP
jgi:hypothetical protein